MQVVIQYFDDCPSWEEARDLVSAAATALNLDTAVELLKIEGDEEARRVGFRGSPSILVNGYDLFPTEDSPIGLSCRVYQVNGKPAGVPSMEQLVEVLRPFAPE